MPAHRMNMRMIKDVLRLKFDGGFSHDRIAASLGISKGVVTKYIGLAGAAGLDWTSACDMDEGELERRLLGKPTGPAGYAQPDYGRIHQELRRKGMTLTLLWEEYQAEFADRQTYRYTQFCEHYKAFTKRLKRSMRQIHRAGEKLFVDFAGPTLPLTTGRRAHIFVAAMGASSYTFACATPAETMEDWLGGIGRALTFYGGVPQLIVPDNPRAMIADPDRYEPRAGDTVLDFARHYGTSFLPARVYRPQDKPKVEVAVQVVERWIMARLRHHRFESIHSVNEAIRPLLENLNERPFQKLPGCRASAFAQLDAPALQPLPAQPYELARFKTVTVHIDYHVEINKHRYSVPHALVGLKLDARITAGAVELLHRGRRVASHARTQRQRRRLHHRRRAHAGGAPRSSAMDASAADSLGTADRRGNRRACYPAAAGATPSGTRLSGVPRIALALTSLWPRTSRSRLCASTGAGRAPLPPCARHPDQQPRPRCSGNACRLDQPEPRACTRPRLLPIKKTHHDDATDTDATAHPEARRFR